MEKEDSQFLIQYLDFTSFSSDVFDVDFMHLR